MKSRVGLDKVYKPSEEVVAREIQGEVIIIPVTSGISGVDDEIFSLNKFGKAIWKKLDGQRKLREVVKDLSLEFEGSEAEIGRDVLGLVEELLKRKMLVSL